MREFSGDKLKKLNVEVVRRKNWETNLIKKVTVTVL